MPKDKRKNGIREAPEVDDQHTYDEKSDVYSLGLVLYGLFALDRLAHILSELLSLVDLSHGTLYALNTTLLAHERVRTAGSLDALPRSFSIVNGVVSDMLLKNPATRPSARQVYRKLLKLLERVPLAGTHWFCMHLISLQIVTSDLSSLTWQQAVQCIRK